MNTRYNHMDPDDFDDIDDAFNNDLEYYEEDQPSTEISPSAKHNTHLDLRSSISNTTNNSSQQLQQQQQQLPEHSLPEEEALHDIEDADYEVHSINTKVSSSARLRSLLDVPPPQSQNNSFQVQQRAHVQHLPPSQLEIDTLFEHKLIDDFVPKSSARMARPGSAGRVMSARNTTSSTPISRPMSARVENNSARTQTRPSSASRQTSILRQKLALPKRLSSIPPPDHFPITSSRSTNSVLVRDSSPKLPRKEIARAYLSSINRQMKLRKIPKNFHQDPEGMYMDLQDLKQEIIALRSENTKLKTQLMKTEAGRTRKQKQVEELLRAHAIVETKGSHYEHLFKEVNLVKKLKERVRDLEQMLAEKDEEFERIKVDSRYTRVRELETELKAYYTESRRLQRIIENTRTIQENHGHTMEELSRVGEENAKLRELVINMKKVQDYYQQQLAAAAHKQEEIQNLSATNQKYANKAKDLKRDKQTLSEELETLQKDFDALQEDYDELKSAHESLKSAVESKDDESKSTMEKLQKEKEAAENSKKEIEVKLQEVQQVKENLEKEKNNLVKELQVAKDSKKELKQQLDAEIQEKLKLKEETADLKLKIAEQKEAPKQQTVDEQEVKKLKTRLKELQAEVENLQSELREKDTLIEQKDRQIRNYMEIVERAKSAEEDDRENHERIVRLSKENADLLQKVMTMKKLDHDLQDEDTETEGVDTETDFEPQPAAKRKYSFDADDNGIMTYDTAANTIAKSWRKYKERKQRKLSSPQRSISPIVIQPVQQRSRYDRDDDTFDDQEDEEEEAVEEEAEDDNTYNDDTYHDDDTYDKYMNNDYENDETW